MELNKKDNLITISKMIENRIHLGHKDSKYNPELVSYILGTRNKIDIFNLEKTIFLLRRTLRFFNNIIQNNGKILFVDSPYKPSKRFKQTARDCNQFFLNSRWIGGLLTNFSTISDSKTMIFRLQKSKRLNNSLKVKNKKLLISYNKRKPLRDSLKFMKTMNQLPDALIILDVNKNQMAINEAYKLNIPVIAFIDSNTNINKISYPIIGNDDSSKTIEFYCKLFVDVKKNLEKSKISKTH